MRQRRGYTYAQSVLQEHTPHLMQPPRAPPALLDHTTQLMGSLFARCVPLDHTSLKQEHPHAPSVMQDHTTLQMEPPHAPSAKQGHTAQGQGAPRVYVAELELMAQAQGPRNLQHVSFAPQDHTTQPLESQYAYLALLVNTTQEHLFPCAHSAAPERTVPAQESQLPHAHSAVQDHITPTQASLSARCVLQGHIAPALESHNPPRAPLAPQDHTTRLMEYQYALLAPLVNTIQAQESQFPHAHYALQGHTTLEHLF